MRNLLRKIYETVKPVSKREFYEYVEDEIEVNKGILLALDQQSEIISGLISRFAKTPEEDKKEDKDNMFG